MDNARQTRARAHVEWVPQQYTQPSLHDYRGAALGPKGYKEKGKRTLDDMEALHQADLAQAASRMEGDEQQQPTEVAEQPSSKRQKIDGVKYIPASGRAWKAPAQRAAAEVMKVKINPTWADKVAAKASRAHFLEHKRAAIDARKEKRKAVALQRKAAEERKKANRGKSEVVQKITSNATLKKMMKSKKQKKTLRKADTN